MPSDVLDLLDHLVDKSLVAFDAKKQRYRLLETVRQYALERLVEAGDEAATRDRHLGFYVALSEMRDRKSLDQSRARGTSGSMPSARTCCSRSPTPAARPKAAWRA